MHITWAYSVSIDRSHTWGRNSTIRPKSLQQDLPKSVILDLAGVLDMPLKHVLSSKKESCDLQFSTILQSFSLNPGTNIFSPKN